jgi:hypothetical protein
MIFMSHVGAGMTGLAGVLSSIAGGFWHGLDACGMLTSLAPPSRYDTSYPK